MTFTLRHIFRVAACCAAVLSASMTAGAQNGSTAYSFLDIPSSTLAYGLGGVNISSIDDDINSADRNPGLLGPEIDMQAGVNYVNYVGASNFGGVKFGRRAGDHGAWMAGVQYLDFGEFQGADINGVLTGKFSPKDLIINGIYAHDISEHWRGGINLKYIYSNYDQFTAMALATDIGVNYYDPVADLSFSVMAANLGGQIKRLNGHYDRLPFDLRAGVSKGVGTSPVALSVTAWNLTRWKLPYYENGDGSSTAKPELKESFSSNLFRHLVFGADIMLSESFRAGVGYNYKTRTDMSTYQRNLLSGFSGCLKLSVKNFALGLALAQPHTGATTVMLNISTKLYEF